MKIRFLTLTFSFIFLMPILGSADQGVVARYVPLAEKVGAGRLSFLFWDVYDAALYAPQGRWTSNAPFALAITYLRNLKGEAIAKRSIEEIKKQGLADKAKLDIWYGAMVEIFPDVEEGTVLIGVRDETGRTLFYKRDIRIGIINDMDFAACFFGIWLNEKTSEPQMREELLGLTD